MSDTDRSWPDNLQRRLLAGNRLARATIVNAGISGNQLTRDHPAFGDSGLHRLASDVLDQPGTCGIIIFQGGNDISGNTPPPATTGEIIAGYREVISIAHRRGLTVLGATILQHGLPGYQYVMHYMFETRNQVNQWIRTSGAIDAVIDTDRALRLPDNPNALDPRFDSGDGVHPNDAGHAAIAAAVPLGDLAGAGCESVMLRI